LSAPPIVLASALHRTLPAQIADRIAAAIVEERFAPGERLNEKLLSEQFGVSRAPLREALRMLETRGLVRITPQRGARVTLLSRDEVLQLFEIREVLVGLAAREVARRWDEALAARLEPALAALESAVAEPDAYARASAAATLDIAHASGNPRLAEMIRSFASQIGRYARLGLAARPRRDRSLRNWRALFGAFRAGDADAADTLQRCLASENREAALSAMAQRDDRGSSDEEPAHRALARRRA
jgi:DNA-binding GntR family transcriptional regulator